MLCYTVLYHSTMYNIILLLAVYGAKNDTGFLRTEAPTPKTMKAETLQQLHTCSGLNQRDKGEGGRGLYFLK